jgi:beta-N-acetylhexosaminidase
MSSKVIGGVLRGQWKFDGLLVTDDLNMGAVFNAGIGKAAASALCAGVDLVLVSYDPDQYYPAVLGAARAHREGLLDAEVLAASRRRIGAAALAP